MTPLQTFIAKNNSIEEISFTAHDHRYFDPSKPTLKYISATTIIGRYEPKFDQDFWSMYTALKDKKYRVKPEPNENIIYVNGVKNSLESLKRNTLFKAWQDATLAQWKVTNEEACERGNQTHDYLENTINQSKGYSTGVDNNYITPSKLKGSITSVHDLDATNLKDTLPSVYTRLSAFINKGCTIFAEKKVRLDLVQIAGMIDAPILKYDAEKNIMYFCILDWKTNKDELKRKPGYYKKELIGGKWIKGDVWIDTNDTFTGSLSHIPYCKFNIYALQLSLYAYILECWGYKLVDNGLEIIHMRPNRKPELIKIPYLKREVELMLQDRLKELNID